MKDMKIGVNIDHLNEFDDFMKFKVKVEVTREKLDLADYYHRIIYSLLSRNEKNILIGNKEMILSNIRNLLDVIYDVRKFVEDEL